MIFLIDYDKKRGLIRSFRSFADEDRACAERIRLEMEIADRAGSEVVILEAADEETLRKTHARYFKSAAELLRAGL